MPIVKKLYTNFGSFRGSPSSNTDWEKLDGGFQARNVKIIILPSSTASLEISLDGKEIHCALPKGVDPMVYDFKEIGVSRIFVRKTGAIAEIYTYAQD